MLSLVLSSVFIGDLGVVKASDGSEDVLDVYEESYYNFLKRNNYEPFESNESANIVTKVSSKIDLSSLKQCRGDTRSYGGYNMVYFTKDGDLKIQVDILKDSSGNNYIQLLTYDYLGSKSNIDIKIPSKLRLNFVSNLKKPTNGDGSVYAGNLSFDVKDLGLAFASSSLVHSTYDSFTLEVPDTVRKLTNQSLAYFHKLTSVSFDGNLTDIQGCIFYDCLNLKTVRFKGGVSCSKLGNAVFQNCKKLEKIDNLTKLFGATTKIPECFFYGCENLNFETNKIPESIKTIGSHAFYKCYGLDYLVLPNLQTIEDNAFDATQLRYIYVGHDIQSEGTRGNATYKIITEPVTSEPLVSERVNQLN